MTTLAPPVPLPRGGAIAEGQGLVMGPSGLYVPADLVTDEQLDAAVAGVEETDPVATAALAEHEALTTEAHGLAALLAEKAGVDHSHAIDDVTGLQTALDALTDPSELATAISAAIAAHAASDATDAELTAAIASEVANRDTAIASAVSSLTAAIALKQDASTAATDAELASEASTRASVDTALTSAVAVRERLRGNRVAMIGDSITGSEVSSANFYRTALLPLNWAHLLSNAGFAYFGSRGVSGNTSAQGLARITDITGMSPKPDWCVVMFGTNDAGSGVSVATYASNISAICDALTAAGIRPVLCTVPPGPTTPTVSPTRRKLTNYYSAWVISYAQRNQIPVADITAATMEPTTGGWLSGYDNGDGIHPNATGAKAIGQAIANALAPVLPPWSPPLATFQTSDSANLLANGLFLTDTNADGVPDSWTKTGSGVGALVTGDSSILGNWMRLSDTVNQFTQIAQNVSAGASTFAVGDRLAFCGRVQNDGTSGQASVALAFTGGTGAIRPLSNFAVASGSRKFYQEMTVPSGTTAIQAAILIQSGTAMDIRVAQLTVLNLTTLGIAAGVTA